MPPREVLTGYLVALIPPSITTLDEQLDFLEEEFVRVVDRALAEPRPEAPLTQRMFDLVRYQRHELHDAGLLTDQEFGDLIAQGSGSARRLENYDRLTMKLAAQKDEIRGLVTELEHRRSVLSRLPFCPDHRDKVAGLDCRECEIERLSAALAENQEPR